MTLAEARVEARKFWKGLFETLEEYRLRLRLLCEEFALAGKPKTLRGMFLI